MEEGFLYRRGHIFISRCAAQRNYAGAPVCSHPWGTWQACNTFRIVFVSSADKDAEKTFDSFNRMHMIWTDRV